MQNPWDVRPKAERGDDTPSGIYLQVGAALSAWETLESTCAELFDTIVAAQPSNRAAFAAFVSVKSASARSDLLTAAAIRAVPQHDPAHEDVAGVIEDFGRFGARRNEIAHGRVYNLAEHGFYLGPNNTMPHKWTSSGSAKYQYISEDIEYYAGKFRELDLSISFLNSVLIQRNIAARNTSSTRSRRKRDGTTT